MADRKTQTAFDRLADRIFKAEMRFNPTEASWLGIRGPNDKKLADRSPGKCVEERETFRDLIKELDGFRPSSLTTERAVDHRLARGTLSAAVAWMDKFPHWELMPQRYVDEAIDGVYTPMMRNYAPVEVRAESVLGRLNQTPRLFRQARQNLTKPPRVFTETAIMSAMGAGEFLDTAVSEFIDTVPAKDVKGEMRRSLTKAKKATEDFLMHLQKEVLPRSTGRFAIGKTLFNKFLRDLHGVPMTADDLLVIGRRAYQRTLKEMKSVASRMDNKKTWEQVLDDLKRDHPSAKTLIGSYTRAMEKAQAFVKRKGLVTFPPGETIEVVPTPVYARPVIPYAAYLSPGPFEKEQKGLFWATPPDPMLPKEMQAAILEDHSYPSIQVTSLHEAYPGHHLQLAIANRIDRPLRHVFTTSVMAEGWALYCEDMMYEQGFYESQAARLLQLKDLLWRACRVTIDVSLHTGKMGFGEAVDFLVKKARLERPNAEAEVRRYCANPSQPMSYVVGKLLILELLDDYKSVHGSGFRLMEFHDDLLSHGTIPVDLVRKEMGIPRTNGKLMKSYLGRSL